jgi:hypothetical protein
MKKSPQVESPHSHPSLSPPELSTHSSPKPSPESNVVQKSPSPKKKKSPSTHHKHPAKKKKSTPLSTAGRKALEASMQATDNVMLTTARILNKPSMMSTDGTVIIAAAGGNVGQQEGWDVVSSAASRLAGGAAEAMGSSDEWIFEATPQTETEGSEYDERQGSEEQLREDEVVDDDDVVITENELDGSDMNSLVSILSPEGGGAEALLQQLRERQRAGRHAAQYSQRPLVKWWQIEAKERDDHWVDEET